MAAQAHLGYLASRISAAKGSLRIVGGDTLRGYGEPAAAAAVSLETGALAGIGAYEPSELYVTVAAGTPLAAVQDALASEGQQLCADPPRRAGSTVGGVYAAGISGPELPAYGSLRDHVLGCRIIDGEGRQLGFGGTVIKNVAGYDVSRLQVGALGTLGVITELTLRVRTIPELETTLRQECTAADALLVANEAAAKGLPLTASAWERSVLHLKLAGREGVVRRARLELGGDEVAAAEDGLWTPLRNREAARFASAKTIWLCRLPPLAALACDDDALIEWHGRRRWFFDDAPSDLRAQVAAEGGAAICYRRPPGLDVAVFPTPEEPVLGIQRQLKKAFDPRNVLNPARLGYL